MFELSGMIVDRRWLAYKRMPALPAGAIEYMNRLTKHHAISMSNLQLMQMRARHFVIICVECVMIRTISPTISLTMRRDHHTELRFFVKFEFKCYLLSELLLCLLCSGVKH